MPYADLLVAEMERNHRAISCIQYGLTYEEYDEIMLGLEEPEPAPKLDIIIVDK